jgi:hypothetical protein
MQVIDFSSKSTRLTFLLLQPALDAEQFIDQGILRIDGGGWVVIASRVITPHHRMHLDPTLAMRCDLQSAFRCERAGTGPRR